MGDVCEQVQESFCLSMLTDAKAGDILMDPFCGTGIIPIEAAQYYGGNVFSICADAAVDETKKAAANTIFSKSAGATAVIAAQAERLPLRDHCLGAIVSDMPWGRRSGAFSCNAVMYPRFLKEAHRVLRPDGRMLLLTLEKGLVRSYLRTDQGRSLWDVASALHVYNGYDVTLFHLCPKSPHGRSVESSAVQSSCPPHH